MPFGFCVAYYQCVITLKLRTIYIYLYYHATVSHCSPTQPSHADGKPYSGIHTTLGWHTSWHGQVTQSCSEDRSSYRCQYPLRSSRVWWKHGHVHAPACKCSASGNKLTNVYVNMYTWPVLQRILSNCSHRKENCVSVRLHL